ncbi:hypothetical protein CXF68_15460 [Tenacibaculum sp. Bg11-29]|uniref:hypothetical protein n=1 Tax=Tenacibaculum sp. Bg11-29 TaxID=2058306 RepID=UPI000C33A236|nr:hypothetical protein [Tenacibaculum sp. Bg11-29]PKH52001.1 hypothetical protein CXF68_15460 [Tenacibaculum sp. Bg11-29]
MVLILVSCKKETKKKIELVKSEFILKSDYCDFKHKMTEIDTLNIFIEHSVCTSSAQERIVVTKKNDSLTIKSEYYSATYQGIPNWELVYNKTISKNDTVWDFESFLVRNEKRMSSEKRKKGRIQIRYKKEIIHLFTEGVIDVFNFMDDYVKTANRICPDYLNRIYLTAEVDKIINENRIKETTLKME